MVGVGLLCDDGGRPNRGDLWTLACALTWAVYIVRLETFAKAFPALRLTAAHLLVVAVLCAVVGGRLAGGGRRAGPRLPVAAGRLPRARGNGRDDVAPGRRPAGRCRRRRRPILYTLEPVFASVFAFLVRNERPGVGGSIGAVLILAAALLAQWPARRPSGDDVTPGVFTGG